jgi:hypothetical protein
VRRVLASRWSLSRRCLVLGATRLSFATLLLISACRSTEPVGIRLSIGGEEVVRAGAVVRLTPLVEGDPTLSPYSFTWIVSDPTIAGLRTTGNINTPSSRELTGLRAGVVAVTVTTGELTSTRQFTVVDERPVVQVALGQSITGHLTDGVGEQRFALTLAAGDAIDLSVTADSVSQYGIQLVSLDGALPLGGTLEGSGTLYGGVVAPRAGTYLLGVASQLKCTSWGSCSAVGPFTVRNRRSEPIMNVILRASDIRVRQGASAMDTTWLQNVGAGILTVQAGTSSSWLHPSASSASVPGPAPEPTPTDPIPAGSIAFTSLIDTRPLAPGLYTDTIGLSAPSSTWSKYSQSGHTRRFVNLRVYDALARVINASTSLFALSVSRDGSLVGANADSLFTVDRVSGAATPLLRVRQGSASRSVSRVVGGLDGVLYFGASTAWGDSLYKVVAGEVVSVTGWMDHWSGGFVVLADGTVYASHNLKLERIAKGGAPEVVASVPGAFIPQVLVYRAADHALYFAGRGQLQRYDIATGVVESRGTGAFESVLAVDAQGNLYVSGGSTIYVLDTSGRELSRFVPPCDTRGVAITGGVVYGACPGYFWTMPVR